MRFVHSPRMSKSRCHAARYPNGARSRSMVRHAPSAHSLLRSSGGQCTLAMSLVSSRYRNRRRFRSTKCLMSATGQCCSTSFITRRSARGTSVVRASAYRNRAPAGASARIAFDQFGDDVDADVRLALPVHEPGELPVAAADVGDAPHVGRREHVLEDPPVRRGRRDRRALAGAALPFVGLVDVGEHVTGIHRRASVGRPHANRGASVDAPRSETQFVCFIRIYAGACCRRDQVPARRHRCSGLDSAEAVQSTPMRGGNVRVA